MKQTQVNMKDLIEMMDQCNTIEDLEVILYEEGYLI